MKHTKVLNRSGLGLSTMSLSFVLLGVLILAVSCGGKQNATAPAELDAMQQTSAPSLIELEDLLTAELERLGVDPAKCTAAAPSAGNAVFDLQAVLHGSGGDPEALASVELTWTERLIGDYKQDGLVNVSDLTPIGVN